MRPVGLFGPLSGWEILVILMILLLLFGGRKIPDLARGLGEGIRNFRSAVKGDSDQGEEGGNKGADGSDR